MDNDKREEKLKAIEAAISQIEKDYGKGSVMCLGNYDGLDISTISTGCLSLDIALGVGGIPRGRIIEVYGPESSGKTTLALHMIAEAQKEGGIAAFIDAEHALDPVYAKNIGVDIDNLYVSQPDSGEQALEIAETMVRSGAIDILVIDSVAALVPKQEIDGEMGDAHMALQARLMSQALRKLTPVVSKSKCAVVFINQLREKVGIVFGNPETTAGGRALKFYSSVRMDIRRLLRTRLLLHSRKLHLILCLEQVYQKRVTYLILLQKGILSRRVVHGLHIMERKSDRAVRMLRSI